MTTSWLCLLLWISIWFWLPPFLLLNDDLTLHSHVLQPISRCQDHPPLQVPRLRYLMLPLDLYQANYRDDCQWSRQFSPKVSGSSLTSQHDVAPRVHFEPFGMLFFSLELLSTYTLCDPGNFCLLRCYKSLQMLLLLLELCWIFRDQANLYVGYEENGG